MPPATPKSRFRRVSRLLGSVLVLGALVASSYIALGWAADLAAAEDPTALNSIKAQPQIVAIAMTPNDLATFSSELRRPDARWEVTAEVSKDRSVEIGMTYGEPADYIANSPGGHGVTSEGLFGGDVSKPFTFYMQFPKPAKAPHLTAEQRLLFGASFPTPQCAYWDSPDGKEHSIQPTATFHDQWEIIRCDVPAIGKFDTLNLGFRGVLLKTRARSNAVGTEEVDLIHVGPNLYTSPDDSAALHTENVYSALTVPYAMTVVSPSGELQSSAGTLVQQDGSQTRTVESDTGDVNSFVLVNKALLAMAETKRQFLWLATGIVLGLVPAALKMIWESAKAFRSRATHQESN